MKFLTTIASLLATTVLAGCGMYGVSYPKPNYDYVASPGDPRITLKSDFGVHTQFRIRLEATEEDDACSPDLRLPYMQAMDSYFRDPEAKGPWTVAVPANQPVVISGQWFRYGTELPSASGRSGIIIGGSPSSCHAQALTFVPRPGQAYVVDLRDAGDKSCEIGISAADQAAVEARVLPACKRLTLRVF